MRQEMVGVLGWQTGSGISWAICKQSVPRSRQITTPTPHRSVFTGRMLFLTPNQQRQSTEGMHVLRECFWCKWRLCGGSDAASRYRYYSDLLCAVVCLWRAQKSTRATCRPLAMATSARRYMTTPSSSTASSKDPEVSCSLRSMRTQFYN